MVAPLLATLVAAPALFAETPADRLLIGARVWSARAPASADALAIRAGRVAWIGHRAEAPEWQGPATEVLELEGALILPGFQDAHIHLVSGAASLQRVDLFEDATLGAVQERIRAFAAAHPDHPWVLGRGWLYGAFPGGLPTRAQLDAVVPDRPAYMECYDGHSGWANSRALELAGVTRETPDPPNGEIVRDPVTGEATGALKESATALVERALPEPGPGERYASFEAGLRHLSRLGITAVQDAAFSEADLPLLERALSEDALPLRIRVAMAMSPADPGPAIAAAARLRGRYRDRPRLSFGAVKGFVDGVIESRTAAVLAPYPGGDERGHPNWSPAALEQAVQDAEALKLQVWLHAIGDRGVRMALDAFAAIRDRHGPRDRRWRIEHIETIHPDDYPRFRELGVLASMQPMHAHPNQNIFDVWAKNAGPERERRAFGWRGVENAGARLAFGSDWPVVTADVRRGLYCAVTRQTPAGEPPGGWVPEQAVDLESALLHYTRDAAWAAFAEEETGSLEPGRRADVVVLSRDLLSAPPAAILESRVLLTLVDGEIVHDGRERALP
jgi:hypothetical protein